MAEKEKRTYLGHGKRVKDYDLVNFSVCLSDIPAGAPFEYNGKKYIKLVIGAKKETNQYGKTHSIWVDTFKPTKQPISAQQPAQSSGADESADDLDIPF
jgi:hypothetical protein